jgi:hypothetical protein
LRDGSADRRGPPRPSSRLADSPRAASLAPQRGYVQTQRTSVRPLPHTRAQSAKEKNMKASEVRVLPALDPGESYVEPVFLLVETALADDGETLTTIDLISSDAADGRDGWTVKTLGQSVPMTHSAACEWAVSYAASRNIPIVYERDGTPATGYAAALSAGAGGSAGAAASSAAK